ncbi:hypothetical protein AVEN_167800-1 [Araneus ventricosus]|uniref:Uncharacterized protein n=1 Tax=Araneus ventricosus TaxID=182803 RepID=A0A4Y2MEM8_ARAVE|nr:hypothetical protein AVEN_167800-1 [Araneus ventricosus]
MEMVCLISSTLGLHHSERCKTSIHETLYAELQRNESSMNDPLWFQVNLISKKEKNHSIVSRDYPTRVFFNSVHVSLLISLKSHYLLLMTALACDPTSKFHGFVTGYQRNWTVQRNDYTWAIG